MERGQRVAVCLLAALAAISAAGCSSGKATTVTETEGETTIIENPVGSPEDYTPQENAYIVAGRLKSLGYYRSEIKGEVVASLFGYKQTISDIHIKNGEESYAQAISSSFLVSVGKQALFRGREAVVRSASDVGKGEWSDDFSRMTLDEYRAEMGNEPTALSSYILNDGSVLSGELISAEEGTFTCRYEISPAAGTARYAAKMKNYGGLDGLPEFVRCTLTLTFDGEWNPVSLTAEDEYKIKKIFSMTCRSTLTETFYDIGVPTEIPDAELFRVHFSES